ncbi:SDR family NAD(P)-dependent oxidoreductase [Cryptosporangium sp. NPDC048952]|uniref:SDR family NAD(P)-dependent oxidoreductase n=1 Tax=Cryptosporangium sp. NPDC048952 TaxID=3363961 RepID=UPI00371DA2DA
MSIVVDLSRAGSDWVTGVEEPSRVLLDALGAPHPDKPIVVVVRTGGSATPVSRAALAAVKGIVGTAALEAAPSRRRVNTVLTGPATTERDLNAVVTHLSDEKDSAFTTGASLDLTTVVSGREPGSVPSAPILITGAAGGLGLATARGLAAHGRPLILSDLPSPALDAAAEELDAPAVPCDVTAPDAVDALAAHPLLTDGLSALLVLHGVGGSGAIDELDPGIRDRSLVINGTGVHHVVEGLLPLVRNGEPGSVVVLASQAGLTAEAGNAAYCAAKFAAVGYVEGLAASLRDTGVRVHAICPGPVDTPLMRAAFSGMAQAADLSFDDYLAQRMAEVPLGRFGAPEHVAAAARLLTDLDATGVVLAATGGVVLT